VTTKLSTWETLTAVDCSAKIEKRGKFAYLSWAWAWAEVKKVYPEANYKFEAPVFFADGSCEVWCSVSIDSLVHDMWLPVMDHRNQSITNPDSRNINDARMRCLVKGLAMHGLGHYIYAGEDLPDQEATAKALPTKADIQKALDDLNHARVKELVQQLPQDRVNSLANDFNEADMSKIYGAMGW
jgi:hypothetical protein